MSKHTPGPWGIEHLHGEINIISCNERDADEFRLGIVYVLARNIGGMIHGENFDDHSEVEANGHLIAAAPELLEALEALAISAPSACCGDFNHKKGDFHEGDEKCPPLDRYEKACLLARAAIAKAKGEKP